MCYQCRYLVSMILIPDNEAITMKYHSREARSEIF